MIKKSNSTDLPISRSMLFVPAHIEKFVSKAHNRGADAYILDLEDSVPAAVKAVARKMVIPGAKSVSCKGASAMVRINQPLRLAIRDLEASIDPAIAAVIVPKVASASQLKALSEVIDELEIERGMTLGHTLIIAQIECANALTELDAIANSSTRLLGMILGSEDFSASVGMEPTPMGLFAPNQAIVFACRRAGILPFGFPASIADYSDIERFRETIREARQLGFVGAFCIHPSQVNVLNEQFSPTEQETEEAKQLIAAFEQGLIEGKGAIELKGKMIDAPVVARAKELLRVVSQYSGEQ